MRLAVLIFLFFAKNIVVAQGIIPLSNIDIEKYYFNIQVKEENDSIIGKSLIIGKIIKPTNTIVLQLKNRNKFGKGMKVMMVMENEKPLAFTHSKDLLKITRANESALFSIYVNYEGIPENGLIIGKNKFGDKTWFGDNWPNRAHYWLPCVDHPADKAKVVWGIKAPKGYTCVANGLPVYMDYQSNDNYSYAESNQLQPIPIKVAVIGIAKLEKKCRLYTDTIEVCNYYYPQTFKTQPNKMDVALDVLSVFEKAIGPYPFDKLYNVQSTTMFGGMENANTIFYDEYIVDDSGSMEALVAHEIAHQWFGNTVTEKDFSHLWLSEGFATFFTNYYLEQKYGVDTLQKRLREDRKKVQQYLAKNKRMVVDADKNTMNLLNANSYQKGGLFLQALREKVNDVVFFTIIRTYYEKFKYKNANTDDFKKVVESIVKKDFTIFFKEWLYSTTLPK